MESKNDYDFGVLEQQLGEVQQKLDHIIEALHDIQTRYCCGGPK